MPLTPFVAVYDGLTDRYLAEGGRWTTCPAEGLLLRFDVARRWVERFGCEPQRFALAMSAGERSVA